MFIVIEENRDDLTISKTEGEKVADRAVLPMELKKERQI